MWYSSIHRNTCRNTISNLWKGTAFLSSFSTSPAEAFANAETVWNPALNITRALWPLRSDTRTKSTSSRCTPKVSRDWNWDRSSSRLVHPSWEQNAVTIPAKVAADCCSDWRTPRVHLERLRVGSYIEILKSMLVSNLKIQKVEKFFGTIGWLTLQHVWQISIWERKIKKNF